MSLNINPSMSNFVTFQTQLVSIMEILAKAAVAEINRCVDDSCAVFRLEITQSQREIEALKHKLRVLERELLKTGHRKKVRSPALVENPSPAERVSGQDWCIGPKGRERFAEDSQDVPPARHSITTERIRPLNVRSTDQLPIKRERPEGELCCSDPLPACTGDEPETELVLVGDSVELREQHRCGHSDEELSGLEFVVKAEQEEEHVAQRLNQTGCELIAGRLNTLDSEYMMYERDNQLSLSSIDEDAAEQCSQSLSIQSPQHHTPATMEVSGNALSSFGASYAEEFDKVVEMPSACSEELRSEAVHTQQGQYRERLVHTVERENQTLLPQQQQHGPSVKHRRGSESPAQPHSGSQYETGSAQSTGAVNSGKRVRTAGFGKKQFICAYCGKIFNFHSNLITHQRVHTGEKPYSCAQCGQCFNRKSNLVRHESLHITNRPFPCTHCGKRFARGSDLRAHQRSHTRERPYHCTQCGKSFGYQRNLDMHLRRHTAVEPYS